MKMKNREQLRNRLMRLLTLVCFFHFSGLNNGFTYFVMSSAGPAPAAVYNDPSFTGAIAARLGGAFNPAHWKSMVSKRKWFGLWGSSARAVHYSSSQIVKKIISKSELVQIWFEQSVKFGNSYADNNKGPLISETNQQSEIQLAALTQQRIGEGIEDFLKYLSMSPEELALKKQSFQFWMAKKYKFGDVPKYLMRARWRWRDRHQLDPGKIRNKLGVAFSLWREKNPPSRVIYSSSGKEDDLSSAVQYAVAQFIGRTV